MSAKKAKAENYIIDVKNCIHYVQYSTTSPNANTLQLETILEDTLFPFLQLLPSQKVDNKSSSRSFSFSCLVFLYFILNFVPGGALF